MIKNIIFDLGGVLVSLNRKNCLDAFTHVLGFPDFGDYLSAYAQKGFFAEFENGDIDAKQFRNIVREHCSAENVEDEQIDFALGAFLTEVKFSKVKLLLELKKKYKLYLLSNINPIAWERSQKLFKEAYGVPIESVFDEMFLSYKLKASKPGKEIFNKLIEKTSINVEQTLFVDDAQANIDTANELGFKTLLYDANCDLASEVKSILE